MRPSARGFGCVPLGLPHGCKSGILPLWGWSSKSVIRRGPGSYRPTTEEALATSERNLKLQLTIPRHLRKGRVRSFASGMNPNPKLWKYRWRIFVTRPGDSVSTLKPYTWAMPQMPHAEFQQRLAWLEAQGTKFSNSNARQRREHPLWNATR